MTAGPSPKPPSSVETTQPSPTTNLSPAPAAAARPAQSPTPTKPAPAPTPKPAAASPARPASAAPAVMAAARPTPVAGAPNPANARPTGAGTVETGIRLPAYVVLIQGLMLALVGTLAFTIGTWFGRAWERQLSPGNGPRGVSITGKIVYRATPNGGPTPDAGAVVLFLPAGMRSSEKLPVFGLRPGDDTKLAQRGLALLRELGGARAVCETDGRFAASLPGPGDYVAIALSAHKPLPPASGVGNPDVQTAAKYLDLAADGFGGKDVRTKREKIAGSTRMEFGF